MHWCTGGLLRKLLGEISKGSRKQNREMKSPCGHMTSGKALAKHKPTGTLETKVENTAGWPPGRRGRLSYNCKSQS